MPSSTPVSRICSSSCRALRDESVVGRRTPASWASAWSCSRPLSRRLFAETTAAAGTRAGSAPRTARCHPPGASAAAASGLRAAPQAGIRGPACERASDRPAARPVATARVRRRADRLAASCCDVVDARFGRSAAPARPIRNAPARPGRADPAPAATRGNAGTRARSRGTAASGCDGRDRSSRTSACQRDSPSRPAITGKLPAEQVLDVVEQQVAVDGEAAVFDAGGRGHVLRVAQVAGQFELLLAQPCGCLRGVPSRAGMASLRERRMTFACRRIRSRMVSSSATQFGIGREIEVAFQQRRTRAQAFVGGAEQLPYRVLHRCAMGVDLEIVGFVVVAGDMDVGRRGRPAAATGIRGRRSAG